MSIWEILLAGAALMLVLEGLMPFIAPGAWRNTMRQAITLTDGQLRFLGLASIAGGLVLLSLVK